jgi:hypothetical protein
MSNRRAHRLDLIQGVTSFASLSSLYEFNVELNTFNDVLKVSNWGIFETHTP